MSTGAWVAIVAVVVAVAFGLYRARTDGRFSTVNAPKTVEPGTQPQGAELSESPQVVERGNEEVRVETVATPSLLAGTPWADQAGERATLLQFSSAFCAPCRATRRILTDVAEQEAGVAHVEVDAELHLDVVRRLGILRTPTTIVLDHAGQELGRAVGAPTKAQVVASLPESS